MTHIILPILGLAFLVLTILLILNRFFINLREPKINAVKTKIDDFLTTLVFSSYDDTELASEIENFKKEIPFDKRWCKKIVLNKIIFLKRNLKGDIVKISHFIYEQFDLFNYSISLLKSKKKYLNCLGMYHLKALEYHKGKNYVTPFLNHKNRILNSSAYLTIISLEPENLGLLYNYQKPIYLAGEINIMNIVHQKKPPVPSNLKDWIHSPNPSVVRLGIKLMAFYNYTNENQSIAAHLKSDDEKIRFAVIGAIRQLFLFDTEKNLIELFSSETKTNQIEILKTLAVIGGEDAEEFINSLLKESIDSDIKLRAVKSLSKMNSTYIENIIGNHEIIKMIQHVKIPSI
ncbi:HEAT repeat domain-containing protein [Flavobacterium palustre]|uniref:HEAT repeat domain-containing protein n=1 Tax=Flavobacterium palustre TaxID=1476463 RepID=UPI001665CEB0|nr:HEAT repeat domain-containing protein [Flavobacterium palustre]